MKKSDNDIKTPEVNPTQFFSEKIRGMDVKMQKLKEKYKKLLNELLDIVDTHNLQTDLIESLSPEAVFHGGLVLNMASNPAEFIPLVDRFLRGRLSDKRKPTGLSYKEVLEFRKRCAAMDEKARKKIAELR